MVVEENASSQGIIFFFACLGKLEREWALGASLSILFVAFVSRFALLAPVAIQDIDAVAVRVNSLSSLRNELDVLRSEELVNHLPYLLDVLK